MGHSAPFEAGDTFVAQIPVGPAGRWRRAAQRPDPPPGAHQTNAQNAITGSRADEARPPAIVALASPVNRLAAAEAIADAQT